MVESILRAKKKKEVLWTKQERIEDYYDINGNFVKSVVKDIEFKNNLKTGKAKDKVREKVYTSPLLSDNQHIEIEDLKTKKNELSEEKENKIKEKIAVKLNELDAKELQDVVGFTYEDISTMKQKVEEYNEAMSFTAAADDRIERKGAYDNYYNYDSYTGDFIVQALGYSAHSYIKYTGNTIGDMANATQVTSFKNNIISYEEYVRRYMETDQFSETLSWLGGVAGLVSFVFGYPTGPVGWAAIVSTYSGAMGVFISWTSEAYADETRLEYSRRAKNYLHEAQEDMDYTLWGDYDSTVVSGF
ncbi:hypothetical protein ACFSCX_11775 [Bacillus salitolerans]|uniref:Uncharacterized protein n=1 Tax=Bacillus salitolerans TaxID=1437434 RepID=A0ABW4LRY2_9BACI